MERMTTEAQQAALKLFERLCETPDGPQCLDGPFQILRIEFDRLSPTDKMTFVRGGGAVIDVPASVQERRPLGPRQAYRDQFDALTPADKLAFVKAGGRIID